MSKKTTKKDAEFAVLKKQNVLLPCSLTPEEHRARGQQLASVLADIKSEESRHDMLKAEMKSAMAALEAQRETKGGRA